MLYLQLFFSFFQIGLFSVGGGYAAMPFIQQQVVELHHWLTQDAFTDIITISQMTPGPIGINSATFVGIQIGGPMGAVAATVGCVLPSAILMLIIGIFYKKYKEMALVKGVLEGLRPAVIALIATAGITIGKEAFWGGKEILAENIDFISIVIFVVSMVLLRKYKLSPVKTMMAAGISGGLIYLIVGIIGR